MIAILLLSTNYVLVSLVLGLYSILFIGFIKYDREGDTLVRNLARAMTGLTFVILIGNAAWLALLSTHLVLGEVVMRVASIVLLAVRACYTLLLMLLLFAAWWLFRFFQELIPEDERAHWHLLFAPFYPRGKGLIVRRREL